MPLGRILHVADDATLIKEVDSGIKLIQKEMSVSTEFPAEVQAQADQITAAIADQGRSCPWKPPHPTPWLVDASWADYTHLPFITIDPESSMDLDQAVFIERTTGDDASVDGFRVWYAIADVSAFVAPGSPLDLEALERGQTLYGADSKVPLYPPSLSEGAASLLPDVIRPAFVWRHDLDSQGLLVGTHVERGFVHSRLKLSYVQAQQHLQGESVDAITNSPDVEAISTCIDLLGEVGPLRIANEIERGGVSLPSPEQELNLGPNGWELEFRHPLLVEDFNAQISLLTGFAAAELMLDAQVGVIRTLPKPPAKIVKDMRDVAAGLKIDWPSDQEYPAFIRSLNAAIPRQAAMIDAAGSLLRGSGYASFIDELPDQSFHAGVGSEYAHTTAPLRRLVDRYALEVCAAICAGRDQPDWVLEALPLLPKIMARSGQQASQYFRMIINLVEAGLLKDRLGETFQATVIGVSGGNGDRGVVVIPDPAVEAPVTSNTELPLGKRIDVTLSAADLPARKVQFEVATS